jgi:UDP-N-acetylglucosamine 2-epimerase (non-hydrolysing)
MLKVMTVVGTRPELIKLSRVIHELDRNTEHVLAHTGQNFDYELNDIFFEQLEIRAPDELLKAGGATPMDTIAKVLTRGDEALVKHKPDALLILGDTNSCLIALAAKRRKIPIFHMEAGNRCFDQRVPEEINRRIVDHVSDINLTYSEHARRYLLAEGLNPETVIKTGSPMREVLDHYGPRIRASKVLEAMHLKSGRYFVLSAHREENVDVPERLAQLVATANSLAAGHDMPVAFSVHPRTRQRLAAAPDLRLDGRVQALKPLGFLDYAQLQRESFCTISDSGTLTEEAALLGFAAVTIRQTHERPEGMDEAALVMSDLDEARVRDAVRVVTDHKWRDLAGFRAPGDYSADNVSKKVLRIVSSYVDYVRRTVWSGQGPDY